MVLEFEGFAALVALEAAQHLGLVVGDHVALEPVDVGELLLTHVARLGRKGEQSR